MGFDTIEMNLLRFIILLAVTEEGGPVELSQCSCGVPSRVGGVETLTNEYPWQVCLVWLTIE